MPWQTNVSWQFVDEHCAGDTVLNDQTITETPTMCRIPTA